jgi:hypothetical protein
VDAVPGDPQDDRSGFRRRVLALTAFGLPIAYASLLATVLVHEVIGHGFGALAAGGTFDEFAVMLDGTGWARTSGGSRVFVLAAGVLADLVVAVPLLLLAGGRWLGRLGCVAAVIFALLLLNDAGPYAFWGAVYARGSSDTARIVNMLGEPAWRWAIVVASGVVYLAAVWLGTWVLFRAVEDVVGPLRRRRALVVAALVAAGASVLWLAFDFSALVGARDRLPQVVGAVLQAGAAVTVAILRPPGVGAAPPSKSGWVVGIACAWLVSGAIVGSVALWMRHGVAV